MFWFDELSDVNAKYKGTHLELSYLQDFSCWVEVWRDDELDYKEESEEENKRR